MDKRKLSLIMAFATLVVLVFSVPATSIWGDNVGAILRWVGVAMGIVYFIIRSKWKKSGEY